MKNSLFSFSPKFTVPALKWLFSISTALLIVSCSSNDRFLADVEKLEETLTKAEESLKAVDTSKTGEYFRISNEKLKFIQENFKDTMDRETTLIIADYAASRKSLRMFMENYSDVTKELDYSRSQLAALKADIQKGLMPEDKFTDYYSSESKSVEKLDELVQNLVQWYDSALKMYEAKSPPVEKIISSLKEKQEDNS